jgi:hypothetical protein
MIFAVSFEIIIQRPVGNEPCDVIKNTLIISVLCIIRSKKKKFSASTIHLNSRQKNLRI